MSTTNTVSTKSTFGTSNIYLVPSFDVEQLDTEITSKLIEDNLLIITDDGTNFEEEKEIYSDSWAGFNGKRVKEAEIIVKSEGKISATGKLVNKKLLEASLYTKDTNTSTKYDVYSVKEGTIASSQYSDVVMVGVNAANELAQIVVLHNAYNANLSIETKSAEKATCKVEFTSAYDLGKLNETPYKIITLKETV